MKFYAFLIALVCFSIRPLYAWECDVEITGQSWVKLGQTTTLTAVGTPPGGTYIWSQNKGNLSANGASATLTGYDYGWSPRIPVKVTYISPPGSPSWGSKCHDTTWIYSSCKIPTIKPDKDQVVPGDTVTFTAQKDCPSSTLVWSLTKVPGSEASATLSNTTGVVTTLTNIEGEGFLTIRAESDISSSCFNEYTIWVGCEPCSGAECSQIGSGDAGLGSIMARIGLGRTEDGHQAGSLLILAETMDPANSTPQILQFNSFNSDCELVKNNGVIRQIVAPEGFINIVVKNPYKYNT
jgi:hypothetical protein